MNTRSMTAKVDAMFGTTGEDDVDEVNTQTEQTGAHGAQSAEDGNGSETPPTQGKDTQHTQQSAKPAANGQPDANAGQGNPQQRGAQQRPNGQGAQGQQPTQRRLPANNNGDLIDAQGNVVARAGNERRYYEAARNAQMQVQRINADYERVQTELNAFREAAVLPQQLGLQPAEVTAAMQFMSHWKKNPVEAATKVLTELRAMGYEVEGLAPSVDAAAIRQMVMDAVAPFRQDREAAAREAEIAAAVDRELNALYTAHPWATNQQTELQALIEADPTLTPREAALHLKAYALENGFDLSQPLRPQILAARNGGQPQQQQPAPQQRVNEARQPAPVNTSDAPIVPRRAGTPTGHERSNRDIVKEAMREAGLSVDHL